MSNTVASFDVVIVGAGLVGLSLARALAALPIRIAIIEAHPVEPRLVPGGDMRHIALTRSSQHVFEHLKLWSILAEHASPISQIQTSDKGHFGKLRLRAEDMDVPALGQVIPMPYLMAALHDATKSQDNLSWFCPAKVTQVNAAEADTPTVVRIEHEGEVQTLHTQLLVGADGTRSTVRSLLDIGLDTFDYQQHAVVTTVTLKAPKTIAFERFTRQGLVALLPLGDDRFALILCLSPAQAAQQLEASDTDFLSFLQHHFGFALGRFLSVSKRMAFPLVRSLSQQQVLPGVALLGNAAHTLHPIAGQGFNLALRDAAALAQTLSEATHAGTNLGELALLQSYVDWRKADQKRVLRFTEGTTRLFGSDFFAFSAARNIGLLGVDLIKPLKQRIARQAMGFYGRMPELACEGHSDGA